LDDVEGPNYGIGYFSLFVLTLIPPLFKAYVQKHLDNWDEKYASSEEKVIAAQFS
jgi:alkane 1-monooxygenase